MNAPAQSSTQYARIIYWRARPGQLEAYSRYLHEYVEPIDEAARQAGVLRAYSTWVDPTPGATWTHMRLFVFDTPGQRAVMKEALGRIAMALTPDAQERARRTALAETLRDLASQQDLDGLA